MAIAKISLHCILNFFYFMQEPDPLNKKIQTNFYSHTKTDISKILYLMDRPRPLTNQEQSIKKCEKFSVITKKQKSLKFSYFLDWLGILNRKYLKFFVIKTDILVHSTKTAIFKILLYIPKTKISENSFVCLSRKKLQSVYIFPHFRIIFSILN